MTADIGRGVFLSSRITSLSCYSINLDSTESRLELTEEDLPRFVFVGKIRLYPLKEVRSLPS